MHADELKSAPEFAEEYTRRERVRFIVLGGLAGALVVAVGKLWFFPWLHAFSRSAHCQSILGVNGALILLHGLFVGVPLFGAIVVGCTVGRRGFKILRQGQVPPAGEKVFRPTRIVRGARAKALGLVHVGAALPLLALAAWGFFQPGQIARPALLPDASCAASEQPHLSAEPISRQSVRAHAGRSRPENHLLIQHDGASPNINPTA